VASPRLANARPVRPEDGIEGETPGAIVAPIALAAHREGARPHRDADHDAPRVIGFGDHLPAFLRRPGRVAGA
jgi:hypothetical protein